MRINASLYAYSPTKSIPVATAVLAIGITTLVVGLLALYSSSSLAGIGTTGARALFGAGYVTALIGTACFAKNITERFFLRELNKHGWTHLHYAAQKGDAATVSRLIREGAALEATDKVGLTPLHCAIINGHTEAAELLLKNRADIEKTLGAPSLTPLHLAVSTGKIEIVRLLLKYRANINARTVRGQTPLRIAVHKGNDQILELLLKAGATVDAQNNVGNTPLHKAAEDGKLKSVELLLKYGASKEIKNLEGRTPLHSAVLGGQAAVVESLISQTNIHEKGKDGCTAFHLAVLLENEILIKLLLEKGAHIEEEYGDGGTPLMRAAFGGHQNILSLLIEKGAQVSAKDQRGFSALHYAAMMGRADSVALLLKRGADINAQNVFMETPCHTVLHKIWAVRAEEPHFRAACLLLLNGANLDLKNLNGISVFLYLHLLNKEMLFRMISALSQDEILVLLKNINLESTLSGDISASVIQEIPAFYHCLVSLVSYDQFKKISKFLSIRQLESIIHVWKNSLSEQEYLERIEHIPLVQLLLILPNDDLPKIRERAGPLFQELRAIKWEGFEARLNAIKNQAENRSLDEVQNLFGDLQKQLSNLDRWRVDAKDIQDFLGEELYPQIKITFENLNRISTELAEYQRSNPFPENAEDRDIFSILNGILEGKKFEDPKRLWDSGLYEGRDLAILGLGDDLNDLLDEVEKTGLLTSLLEWKSQRENSIKSLQTMIAEQFPDEAKQLESFFSCVENVCNNPNPGNIKQLREQDRARRRNCLHIYLSQEKFSQILDKGQSLSEWAQMNQPQSPLFFYSLLKETTYVAKQVDVNPHTENLD